MREKRVMANTIKGTAKADKLAVNENDVTLTAGKGNDIITVKKGRKSVIHGNGGNDTIKMTGGSYSTVYGDEGAENITVGAKVLGATVFGGSGKDRITVNSTKTYKSKYQDVFEGQAYTQISYIGTYVDAGNGDDTIVVNAGVGHTIYGGKGKDNITIGKKAQAYVDGGAGNDIITVESATQGKYVYNGETRYIGTQINAGSGADSITVTAGKGHMIFTGSGNDTVEIKGGKNGTVTYASGNNEFAVTGGRGYKFESEYIYDGKEYNPDNYYSKSTKWKSMVSISGGSNNSIECGNGDDTVVIKGGKNNNVSVRDGNDYVEITGGSGNSISMRKEPLEKAIGQTSVYIKGGTGTSVFSGDGKNSEIYVKGGGFKNINSEGGTVFLSSKVKYGVDASVLSRRNGSSDNPVNYMVAWKDTINLSFEGNADSYTDTLTLTGVRFEDLMVSTEFKDYAQICSIVGKNGGKMTFAITKGGWDFASITVGNEIFNYKSGFVSALERFNSGAMAGMNNNYTSK